jgi:hypothetical protein
VQTWSLKEFERKSEDASFIVRSSSPVGGLNGFEPGFGGTEGGSWAMPSHSSPTSSSLSLGTLSSSEVPSSSSINRFCSRNEDFEWEPGRLETHLGFKCSVVFVNALSLEVLRHSFSASSNPKAKFVEYDRELK